MHLKIRASRCAIATLCQAPKAMAACGHSLIVCCCFPSQEHAPKYSHLVALVVHPPRAGLHRNALFLHKYPPKLHVSSQTLQEHAPKYSHVVAVVDPPRAGLHRNVLRALLACKELKRLVFVSCNPDSLVLNAGLLCGRYQRDWPVGSRSRYHGLSPCAAVVTHRCVNSRPYSAMH